MDSDRLAGCKPGVFTAALYASLSRIDPARDHSDARFASLRDHTDAQCATMRADLTGQIGEFRADMNSRFEVVHSAS
jgi:hypothetical protein